MLIAPCYDASDWLLINFRHVEGYIRPFVCSKHVVRMLNNSASLSNIIEFEDEHFSELIGESTSISL